MGGKNGLKFLKVEDNVTKGELDPGCCFFDLSFPEIHRFLRFKKMEPYWGERLIFHIGFIFQTVSCFCIIGFLHSSLSNLVGFNDNLISHQAEVIIMKMTDIIDENDKCGNSNDNDEDDKCSTSNDGAEQGLWLLRENLASLPH